MFMGISFDNIMMTTYMTKIVFITICTYFTILKITGKGLKNLKQNIIAILCLTIITIITTILRYHFNPFIAIVWLIFSIAFINSIINKSNIGHSIVISIISISFNYILFFCMVVLTFIINIIFLIKNDTINLIIMMILHTIILCLILRIRKLKNGISFFNNTIQNDYLDAIIINVSVSILLSLIIFSNVNILTSKSVFIGFIIFSIIMIITIQKSFQLYYKHKLLIKELDEMKADLDSAKKNIEKLESENLNISKKNHSLVHKQKTLEHKIDKLMLNEETAEELDVKNKLGNLSKEMYTKPAIVELAKTEINEIDDMLDCLKSECEENDIDFNLQLNEDIHYMVNNLVSKEELITLIADHIRDAIIAIKHSENINRSILVRLGKIDEYFGLYIYDTGIEFEKETLENIGKRPYTTHKDEGGTGLGFMNTFETLKRRKASLIIEEIGKPCKDNFTKIIKIRFDEKDEFKVISYKEN